MESKKGGFLSVRVSDIEKAELKKNANNCGMSLSSYMIKSGLNQTLPKKLSEKELEIYSTLMQFKTNFSRISNLMRSMNQRELLIEISNVVNDLNQELRKIKNG